GQVLYLQADVCDQARMKEGLSQAKERFGEIRGVVHTAGLAGGGSILDKDISSFEEVLGPKIKGTIILDELLCREPLDFICYFSSSAAILGDFGSCDYAVGNRFLMAYGHYRNNQQPGKTVVINWPLWKEGGMGSKEGDNAEMYLKSSGQRFLETEEGIFMFDRLLAQNDIQHLVLAGQPSRVHRFLGLAGNQSPAQTPDIYKPSGKGRRTEMKGLSLEQCLEWDLKELAGNVLKISRDKLDKEENFADFGFDSFSLAEFATILTGHYGIEITPAVFFGHSTIERLTQYFFTEHQQAIQDFYREDAAVQDVLQREPQAAASSRQRAGRFRFAAGSTPQGVPEPIAVIGMSGRFPGADTVEGLWNNLKDGRECITEIPASRWDWQKYYGDPHQEDGKTNSRWGGFISNADQFDSQFFEISPREAQVMDPRQRLLLQEAWKALEDAGYGAKQIKTNRIGMFVGVEQGDYQLLVKEKASVTSNNNAILAARLAYFLNLSGPVMAIDTACSSGLVAAHQACLSLRGHECDTAIAAGINLMLTPQAYIGMSQAGMLSADGKCFAFDKRANGLVPGEAVAAVVLKRLSRAEADGDPIYAVIQGNAVNYDGRTNGITAPSGVAQTSLLKAVYDQFKVNPEEIEYIVTHGTGTRLGDPVEINALYDAFKGYTSKQGYCALTSTKTNFGHTFAASGLLSLISLVEALRHETIPASLHCEQENDYINWKESPFYVNKAAKPWPKRDGKVRTGAVSAFGMSGTNVHMVVRSYSGKDTGSFQEQPPYYLLVLSAKTEDALQEKIQDMITVLQNKGQDLLRISYTGLEGRQHFNHRCAIVIQDHDDAIYVWKQAGSRERLPNLFKGKVPQDFKGQNVVQQYAQDMLKQSKSLQCDRSKYQEMLFALADFYCQGYEIDWSGLFGGKRIKRISLPTYPFAKERYWVRETETTPNASPPITGYIHPLLHQNTSDFSEQRFTSTFTGQEFLLADHVVQGQHLLPGVAYLEMARAAVEQVTGALEGQKIQISLKNIVWMHPITVRHNPARVHIGLYPEENGEITYVIYSQHDEADTERVIHSQGVAMLGPVGEGQRMDLQAIKSECDRGVLSSAQCYEAFSLMGFDYGPGYQGLEKVYLGSDKVLAKISLPSSVCGTGDQFVMHPSLMDSALQASIGLLLAPDSRIQSGGDVPSTMSLPFALQEMEIFRGCSSTMWVLLRYSNGTKAGDKVQKLDIDLCDDQGRVCIRMKGFSTRMRGGDSWQSETIMMTPVWDVIAVEGGRDFSAKAQRVVIVGGREDSRSAVLQYYPDAQVLEIKPRDTIEIISKKLLARGAIDHIIWIAPYKPVTTISDDILITDQNEGVLQVFRIIKALLGLGYADNDLSWSLITVQVQSVHKNETINPTHASLHGLIGSMAKEYPHWKVRLIDLNAESDWPIDDILNLPADPEGDILAYRGKEWYRQQLIQLHIPAPERTLYRPEGVYVVIGGAGGIGEVWTEYMIRTYQAHVIWIGRREKDATIQAKLDRLASLGPSPQYIKADATDQKALQQAYEKIKKLYPQIHGVVHSAIVLLDKSLANMDEERFNNALSAKVNVSVRMAQVFQKEPLDFVLFFSGLIAFTKSPGQSNYASGCAFEDAFASRLSQEWPCVVKVMNWGYWGSVGVVAAKAYQDRMAQVGVGSIEPPEAMEALEVLLAGTMDQIALVKTTKPNFLNRQ
ncbi:6-deoxyerythronolide-B synthase, partial [Ruminiclostridium papyrosolvens DSM 2782]